MLPDHNSGHFLPRIRKLRLLRRIEASRPYYYYGAANEAATLAECMATLAWVKSADHPSASLSTSSRIVGNNAIQIAKIALDNRGFSHSAGKRVAGLVVDQVPDCPAHSAIGSNQDDFCGVIFVMSFFLRVCRFRFNISTNRASSRMGMPVFRQLYNWTQGFSPATR